MKFKKGDEIIVTSGKDKGKKGKIEKILPKKQMVVVAGINMFKRHTKSQGQNKGGILDIIKPVNVAKIAFFCSTCKKAVRIGFEIDGDQKIRICKKCKQKTN
jgi:large subunit ribosomal protein L24